LLSRLLIAVKASKQVQESPVLPCDEGQYSPKFTFNSPTKLIIGQFFCATFFSLCGFTKNFSQLHKTFRTFQSRPATCLNNNYKQQNQAHPSTPMDLKLRQKLDLPAESTSCFCESKDCHIKMKCSPVKITLCDMKTIVLAKQQNYRLMLPKDKTETVDVITMHMKSYTHPNIKTQLCVAKKETKMKLDDEFNHYIVSFPDIVRSDNSQDTSKVLYCGYVTMKEEANDNETLVCLIPNPITVLGRLQGSGHDVFSRVSITS